MKRFSSDLLDPMRPWSSFPGRNLDCDELVELVGQIGRDVETWRGLVGFSDSQRHYASLHRDEHVDIWLLCWTSANDTGWHDHDGSSGAVQVVAGTLTECSLRLGGDPAVRTVSAGQAFSFGPDHIHRVTGAVGRSISIHAYSPPLVRLGQYSIDDDGVMRRQPVSYQDELRALDSPLAV